MIEVITQISTIIALWVAIYGIDSWRREHIGRKRADTAEETLALMYEASDAIEHIRHPVSFSTEYGEIERGDRESEQEWQARKNANVAFVRYNQHQELFNKLYAMRYRFMAQFDTDKTQPLIEIHTAVSEVLAAANALSRLWPREYFSTDEQWESHQKLVEKYEAKFWNMMSEQDELANRVKRAVSAMEGTVHAEIDGRGTLYSFINRKL